MTSQATTPNSELIEFWNLPKGAIFEVPSFPAHGDNTPVRYIRDESPLVINDLGQRTNFATCRQVLCRLIEFPPETPGWLDMMVTRERDLAPMMTAIIGAAGPDRNIWIDRTGRVWFWNETETECCGPYNTLQSCREDLKKYFSTL